MANQPEQLKSVYVARTVEESQKKFDSYLKTAGRTLRPAFTIRNITSTHLTFMSSRGVKEKMKAQGYRQHEARVFIAGLQKHLNKGGHHKPLRVRPDQNDTLYWPTGRPGRLAVRVMLDEQLVDARGQIEEYTTDEFGPIDALQPFDQPHITIGQAHPANIPPDARVNPNRLLGPAIKPPHWVALNGLVACLGPIHSQIPRS
jgi:hypothetical protein